MHCVCTVYGHAFSCEHTLSIYQVKGITSHFGSSFFKVSHGPLIFILEYSRKWRDIQMRNWLSIVEVIAESDFLSIVKYHFSFMPGFCGPWVIQLYHHA
jgi:hypothetical protein